jgi:hypothetical protein
MSELPATLTFPLYRHQAIRLVRELGKAGCRAAAFPDAATTPSDAG